MIFTNYNYIDIYNYIYNLDSMLYQLVLVDSNNYIQTFESEDIQIINTQTSLKGDSYTVAFKELKYPFIIVQKMISNQTNKKINFSKNKR